MKIQSISLVVGGSACDAKCPYCVARLTGKGNAHSEPPNMLMLNKAIEMATRNGVCTAILTGKGEPCVQENRHQIMTYLEQLSKAKMPFVCLQTNGLWLGSGNESGVLRSLGYWRNKGLTTVSISVVSWQDAHNAETFTPGKKYIDLARLVGILRGFGLVVRLSCILCKGYVDTPARVMDMVGFCKDIGAHQLTLHPVTRPAHGKNSAVEQWVEEHELTDAEQEAIRAKLRIYPKLMSLAHGGVVHDVNDISVGFSECLTIDPEENGEIRQLIYYPDGRIMYDWVHKAAILG
jgi:molybdenum cofactor biosynthesis enzyme MoaA